MVGLSTAFSKSNFNDSGALRFPFFSFNLPSSYYMTCEDNAYTFFPMSQLTPLRYILTSSHRSSLPNTVDCCPKPIGFLESSDPDVISVNFSDD